MSDGQASRHVGVIGLAVMGENLALNIERNGFPIAVYNRTYERTDAFIQNKAHGLNIAPGQTLQDFVGSLERKNATIKEFKGDTLVFDFNGRTTETQASKVTRIGSCTSHGS